MQHSVKYIGEKYEELSELREDEKKFSKEDFLNFAKENIEKYSIIENGDDLLVSTWCSDELIKDYKQTM